jgi:hypothetical protein
VTDQRYDRGGPPGGPVQRGTDREVQCWSREQVQRLLAVKAAVEREQDTQDGDGE